MMIFYCLSCNKFKMENIEEVNRPPHIFPDYNGVTIPFNIAPLNFKIEEENSSFYLEITAASGSTQITLKSSNRMIQFPLKTWKKLTEATRGETILIQIYAVKKNHPKTLKYQPIIIHVANQEIDPWLVYRLIHPGYYSWSKINITQRSLENFDEESIIENQLIEKNCINCHSFHNGNPDKFLFHMRGSRGGTYFVDGGDISRKDIKAEGMPGGATYPSWHPDGKYVVFSSNQVRQNFYAHPGKSIEVYDLISSLYLYNTENAVITAITDTDSVIPLQTFPSWSPDGKYLYYCDANTGDKEFRVDISRIKDVHYNLKRRTFDPTSGTFGEPELIFNASELNKSVSFPRISPDGKFLVLTLADYGTFPIWHTEADLHLLNLEDGTHQKMNLNSEETESYHTWSSNGSWLVFSSKRLDSRSTRPFIAYIDQNGNASKPFVLPQKDPVHYEKMLESFNIPELVHGKVKVRPRIVESASRQESLVTKQNASGVSPQWYKKEPTRKQTETEKGIHE